MKFFSMFILGIMFIQGAALAGSDDDLEPAEYFFIPKGSVERGQQAFQDLKCTACHQTANQMAGVLPVAARLAPILGPLQAEYPAGWIANSIVSPSHTIAIDSEGRSESGNLSRMPDLTNVMTVRQLFDLVAFIQSQGDAAV